MHVPRLAPAQEARSGYFGSILFQDDELVLCLFDAASSAAVKGVAEWAGIPCERVMNSQWRPHSGRPVECIHGGRRSPLVPNRPHKEATP
jgi:hypothetical protein